MSGLYGDTHRALQDGHDSRRLADLLESTIVHDRLTPEDIAFISGRDMVFLSTVDADGRPTVSYKGGAPGFVQVADEGTLLLPNYDGNGMFYSLGNVAASGHVGLLFIDFETPHRLRVHGVGTLVSDPGRLAAFPGATDLVSIAVERIFVNCPRYIHPHRKVEPSRYVPAADAEAPIPAWKRIDFVQDHLPERDQPAVKAAGAITIEDYFTKVAAGDA